MMIPLGLADGHSGFGRHRIRLRHRDFLAIHTAMQAGCLKAGARAPIDMFLAGDSPMLTDVNALNERWFQAWREKDATTVERLMAGDYVYIAPSGVVLDRQAILAIIRAPSYRLEHFARTEIVVRAVGNEAAVVRDRRQSAGSFEGAAFTEEHRGVMVWAKDAGEWRLVMEQCSFSSK
jgi:uncharacterized protein (TIGR02246 family)